MLRRSRIHGLLAIGALAAPGALDALPAPRGDGSAIERILGDEVAEPGGGAPALGIEGGSDLERLEEQVLDLLPEGAVVGVARALVERRVGLSVSSDRTLVTVRIPLE
ncbi:MAG TPA: hypothetical protein VN033_07075 [Vulgatibacter sp.]|nr:hypothetical protein [Vulgatibacter sp.]